LKVRFQQHNLDRRMNSVQLILFCFLFHKKYEYIFYKLYMSKNPCSKRIFHLWYIQTNNKDNIGFYDISIRTHYKENKFFPKRKATILFSTVVYRLVHNSRKLVWGETKENFLPKCLLLLSRNLLIHSFCFVVFLYDCGNGFDLGEILRPF